MFLRNKKYTIILVLAILAILVFVGYKWYEGKMKLVERGLADPKFPYHEYSLLELARQGVLLDLNDEMRAEFEKQLRDLPTRTTPQETFDIYIQVLKDGDIEKALQCIIIEEPSIDINGKPYWEVDESEKRFLYQLKEEEKLEHLIRDLEKIYPLIDWSAAEEKIEQGLPIIIFYKYPCIYKKSVCSISFEKDLYGNWKLISALPHYEESY